MAESSAKPHDDGPLSDARVGQDTTEKYLTFRLGAEEYGLEILKVREIIGLMMITPVPRAPGDVRGVINLRGKIIPVVDLRRRFGMAAVEENERNCIIVVDVASHGESVEIGVLVDEVSEVLDIPDTNIGPAPQFGDRVSTEFILGMAKVGDRVTILLKIEIVLVGVSQSLAELEPAMEAVA